MNARLYDPAIGRFLSPDPYVQAPGFSQSFNRYSYCFNNPLKYTDPDGEFFLPALGIVAAIYGTVNTVIHYKKGNIDNFWQGLGYFATGAVVGAVSFATSYGIGSLAMAGINSTSLLAQIGGCTIMGAKGISVISTATSMISNPENAGKILMGKAYVDDGWRGLWQGISRFTWEAPQTWLGYNVSQILNTVGITDKVEYWGGATFSTTRNQKIAVSIGNYINVRTQPYDNFNDYILTDQTVMHEYGHTFDSRIWGPFYLLAIGAPSLISANNSQRIYKNGLSTTTHRIKWYERSASRNAKIHFRKYGVIWDDEENPTY